MGYPTMLRTLEILIVLSGHFLIIYFIRNNFEYILNNFEFQETKKQSHNLKRRETNILSV